MAVPTYRAGATGSGINVTSISVTIPATVVAGDALLLFVSVLTNRATTTPSGWTLVRGDIGVGDPGSNELTQRIYRRIAQAGDAGSTLAVSFTGGSYTYGVAQVHAWSGVDPTNPVNVHGAQATTTNASVITAPSVTTTVDDCLIIECFGSSRSTGTSGIFTQPATIRGDIQPAGTYAASTVCEQSQATAGATGAKTASTFFTGNVGTTLALAPMSVPDTLTATLDASNARVSVALNWPSSPVPETATIERVNADGSVTGVRGAELVTLVAGAWVGDDYEAPLDESFYYVATSTDRPGESLTSETYTMSSDGLTWLKHPGKPFLNMVITISQPPNWVRPVSQGIFDVLGRSTPVAVTMRRSAARGELTVATADEAQRLGLLSLLDDGSPLYLQTPAGYGVGNIYISVGELTEERVTRVGQTQERRWTLPATIVNRPVGGVLATGNSWSDVLGEYASWSDLLQTEGSWEGVLQGIEGD
jgi:hypothetical protein